MKRKLSAAWSPLMALLLLCAGGSSHAAPGPGGYQLRYSLTVIPNGSRPDAGLVADAAGNLYGTTEIGGSSRSGAVYRIDARTGAETVLHSFDYRTHSGAYPSAALVIDGSGNLYGVTPYGGEYGDGVVFRIDAKTDAATVLHNFGSNALDGENPRGSLRLDAHGNLFGTTQWGGANESGTVFEITSWGSEIVLASFGGSGALSPRLPSGDIALDAAGNVYGTSKHGGTDDFGTVWRLSPPAGGAPAVLTVLHSFIGMPIDGEYPVGGVRLDAAGTTLYGTTNLGGADDAGTVFRCGVDGSGERTLHAFGTANDGAHPLAPLVIDGAGVLYGTTESGGSGYGTVFALDPASGIETVLHRFGGYAAGDGGDPLHAGLMIDSAGDLVGATQTGGSYDNGTVYSLQR